MSVRRARIGGSSLGVGGQADHTEATTRCRGADAGERGRVPAGVPLGRAVGGRLAAVSPQPSRRFGRTSLPKTSIHSGWFRPT